MSVVPSSSCDVDGKQVLTKQKFVPFFGTVLEVFSVRQSAPSILFGLLDLKMWLFFAFRFRTGGQRREEADPRKVGRLS